MRIKKRCIVLISLVVCAAGYALCFVIPQLFDKSPIQKYDFENCNIGVLDYGRIKVLEYLSDEQCDEFIGILMSAELSKKGVPAIEVDSIGDYGGFCVYLESGDTLLLQQRAQYLLIDDKAYECYNDAGGKLWRYLNDVYKRHYPVN